MRLARIYRALFSGAEDLVQGKPHLLLAVGGACAIAAGFRQFWAMAAIADPKSSRSRRALRTSNQICRAMSVSGRLVRRPYEI
jgi:hypothetical protein